MSFGKSLKNFASKYDETARDMVAFANNKGGFLFIGIDDKIEYVKNKKQEKARQKEAILRYLDSIETINNAEARRLLKLQDKDRAKVSRLFAELVKDIEIVQTEDSVPNNVKYKRLRNF